MKPKPNRVLVHSAHRQAASWRAHLARRAKRFLARLRISGSELSLALVGDAAIRRLNRAWRRIDRPTDVLSFPAGKPLPGARGPTPLGDVILSLDTAERAAKARGRTMSEELDRYLAHGLLHLMGHGHHGRAEARRMAAAEEVLLGGEGMLPARRRRPSPGAKRKKA